MRCAGPPEIPRRDEVLVHECGHVFGMAHWDPKDEDAHPDHANYAESDGCVMVKVPKGATPPPPEHDNNWLNAIALFGGPTSPPDGEPKDLKDSIAGRTDSLHPR